MSWKTFFGACGVLLLASCACFAVLWWYRSRPRDSVTIHWNTVYQTIDGFGASATGYVGNMPSSQASRFFDPQSGLGLSLLRLAIIPTTDNEGCRCVSNSAGYKCVANGKSQLLSGDLQVAQLAAAHGVQLLAAPWSPPAEMKSSGNFCGGGAMKGNAANYADYASRLAAFPELLKEHGLAIDSLSVQNEPDIENEAYDTCRWSGRQIHDFIPYLSTALRSAGFGGVKIAAPEESEWTFDLLGPLMKDPEVANKIGLITGHAYRTEKPSGLPETNGLHIWQTEASDYDKFDGSIRDGVKWARYIHNYLAIGTNAWLFWSLDCSPDLYNKDNNMCLTDRDGHFAKRAYVLGQYSRFVRPGWERIGVSNRGELLITAFKGPANRFAIVAVNGSAWPVRKQTFELSGGKLSSQVTPWITTRTASLEKQLAISATGTDFVYTIPALSVVTFEGQLE